MNEISSDDFKLMNLLREVEDITDLNGCFFINIEKNAVIESTISFGMPESILWEIGVLIDTFRQYSLGIEHGELNELMLEGEKGYILLYFIPPHLILMALGSEAINLSYVKLAMIDILNRMRKKLFEIGDEILRVPSKTMAEIAIESKKMPTLITATPSQSTIITTPSKPTTIPTPPEPTLIEPVTPEPVIKELVTPEPAIKEPVTPEPVIKELVTPEPAIKEPVPLEPTLPPSKIVEKSNIIEMIELIPNKNKEEKYVILKEIFESLKQKLKSITGVKFAELLDLLKDAILNNLGTSLALFDISKASREVIKITDKFKEVDIKKYQNRIDNWINRIIKI